MSESLCEADLCNKYNNFCDNEYDETATTDNYEGVQVRRTYINNEDGLEYEHLVSRIPGRPRPISLLIGSKELIWKSAAYPTGGKFSLALP